MSCADASSMSNAEKAAPLQLDSATPQRTTLIGGAFNEMPAVMFSTLGWCSGKCPVSWRRYTAAGM